MKIALLLALFCLGLNGSLRASCSCDGRHPGIRARLARSAAVFVGTAVYEFPRARHIGPPGRTSTTLLVEQAWKGVSSDTITVSGEVAGNCSNKLSVGRTYLVFAESHAAGFVVPIICKGPSPDLNPVWRSSGANASSMAAAMIDSLGSPIWTARPPGSKKIDFKQPSRRTADIILTLAEGYFLRGRMPDIELLGTGQRVTARAEGYAKFHSIVPGFHRARVHLRSGVREDHYIWVRCTTSDSPCMSRVIWLRTPPALWGDTIGGGV